MRSTRWSLCYHHCNMRCRLTWRHGEVCPPPHWNGYFLIFRVSQCAFDAFSGPSDEHAIVEEPYFKKKFTKKITSSTGGLIWAVGLGLQSHPPHLKPCPHCRRKVRLSPKTARQRRNSATVALFCDSVDRLLYNHWKLRLACVRDKLRNHVTQGGNVLHTDRCRACEGRGLGLFVIGVLIGQRIVLLTRNPCYRKDDRVMRPIYVTVNVSKQGMYISLNF